MKKTDHLLSLMTEACTITVSYNNERSGTLIFSFKSL